MTAQIIQGKCEQIMLGLPAQSVDLVLTDPPSGETQNDWDTPLDLPAFWRGIDHVLKLDGTVVLFASSLRFAAALLTAPAIPYRYEWIWEKNKATNHLNAKKQPMRCHEYLLVFYRRLGVYNPQKSDGHAPMHAARRRSHGKHYGAFTGVTESEAGTTQRYPRSVLRFPIVNHDDPRKTHECQKPDGLLSWLIRTYTHPGAVVLDACAGSGSTGDAALGTTRCAILIEKKKSFVTRMKARFAWTDWDEEEVRRELETSNR